MPQVAPNSITPRAVALVALKIALDYAAAKVHEEGGNNRGDQVEFYQHLLGNAPGDPWCADFVSSCEIKGYARAHGLPEDRASLPRYVRDTGALLISLSGSCDAIAKAAKKKKWFKPPSFAASPADIVLFDIPDHNGVKLGYAHHVGLVVKYLGNLYYQTVEGNTSSGVAGSQGDGDGVFVRRRHISEIYGFVHFG